MGSEPPTILEQPEPAPAPATRWLEVQDGEGKVLQVAQLTRHGLRVGRGQENDVILADMKVSHKHAAVQWDGLQARVVDRGSTNGSWLGSTRLVADAPSDWTTDAPLKIGPYLLRLVTKHSLSTSGSDARRQSSISLSVQKLALELVPGQATQVNTTIRNSGALVDQVDISVDGVPRGWVRATLDSVRLLPGEQTSGVLTILVPREPASEARVYDVMVKANSRADPAAGTAVAASWTVQAFLDPHVEPLAPVRVHGTTLARYTAALRNGSNTPLDFGLSAVDDERILRFRFDKQTVKLAAGETRAVELQLHKRRRWIGPEQTYRFTLRVDTTPSTSPLSTPGEFVQHSVALPLVIGAVLLLVLLVGVATAFPNAVTLILLLAYIGALAWFITAN